MAQTKNHTDWYKKGKTIYVEGSSLLMAWSEYSLKYLDLSKPVNYVFVLLYAKILVNLYTNTLEQSLSCVREAIRIQPDNHLYLLLESVILYTIGRESFAILSFRRAFCLKNPDIGDPLYGLKFSDKKREYEKAISKTELQSITEILELNFWPNYAPKTNKEETIEQLEQQFIECQEVKEKVAILQKINRINHKNKKNPREVCDFLLLHTKVLLNSDIPYRNELFYIHGDCLLKVDLLEKDNIDAAKIYFAYTDGLRAATSGQVEQGRVAENLEKYKNLIINLIKSIATEEKRKRSEVGETSIRTITDLNLGEKCSIGREKISFCLGDIYKEIEKYSEAIECYLDGAIDFDPQDLYKYLKFSKKITKKLIHILQIVGAEEMGKMLDRSLKDKSSEPFTYCAEIWKTIGNELYHSEIKKYSPTRKGYLQAIEAFTKAFDYSAEWYQPDILILRGITYFKLENMEGKAYAASKKDLEDAKEKDKTPSLSFRNSSIPLLLLRPHLYRKLIKNLAEIYLRKEWTKRINFRYLFNIEREYYEQLKKRISETYYADSSRENNIKKISRRISETYYVEGCLIYERSQYFNSLPHSPNSEVKEYLNRSLNAFRKAFSEIQSNWKIKNRDNDPKIDYFMLEIITEFVRVSRDIYEEDYSEATQKELKEYGEIQAFLNKGSNILSGLLKKQKEGKLKKDKFIREKDLQEKFDIIESFRISSFKDDIALEQAEIRKNICLTKLFYKNNKQNEGETKDFTYEETRKILNLDTAIVYWYISITEITSFILYKDCDSEARIIRKTLDYKQYIDFQKNIYSWELTVNGIGKYPDTNFLAKMERCLENFYTILDINSILEILSNKKHLKNIILIPHRDLHKIPLHIFFNNLKYRNNDHNINYNLSYLPSIKLGLDFDSNISFTPSLLVVHPFNISNQDLLNSYAESAGVFLRFCDASPKIPEKLEGDPGARREKVSRRLEVDINFSFLHFLGHAYHDFDKPQHSALKLTGDKPLTLQYILNELDLSNYYLVCLSACETGVTSTESPLAEYVGLISAFLERGVSYIISSLWKIEDMSTSFLMIELYRLISIGEHPVKALAKAQRWLRTVSRKELSTWCKVQASELYRIIDKLMVFEHEKQKLKDSIQVIEDYSYILSDLPPVPFKHPYYWAGFIITGLPPLIRNSNSSNF